MYSYINSATSSPSLTPSLSQSLTGADSHGHPLQPGEDGSCTQRGAAETGRPARHSEAAGIQVQRPSVTAGEGGSSQGTGAEGGTEGTRDGEISLFQTVQRCKWCTLSLIQEQGK